MGLVGVYKDSSQRYSFAHMERGIFLCSHASTLLFGFFSEDIAADMVFEVLEVLESVVYGVVFSKVLGVLDFWGMVVSNVQNAAIEEETFYLYQSCYEISYTSLKHLPLINV